MGHGTVAPIGAALARPGRPVIAIVGDGCFAMNGMELLTAAEYRVPVVWIVENNNMHGITWHGGRVVSPRGRTLDAVRYRRTLEVASIARAMGLEAVVIDRPGMVGAAIDEWLQRRAPTVIEVRVDGSVVPPLGARTTSLAGFIGK